MQGWYYDKGHLFRDTFVFSILKPNTSLRRLVHVCPDGVCLARADFSGKIIWKVPGSSSFPLPSHSTQSFVLSFIIRATIAVSSLSPSVGNLGSRLLAHTLAHLFLNSCAPKRSQNWARAHPRPSFPLFLKVGYASVFLERERWIIFRRCHLGRGSAKELTKFIFQRSPVKNACTAS